MKTTYDKFPTVQVPVTASAYAVAGWTAIGDELRRAVAARGGQRTVICVDLYHGVWEAAVLEALREAVRPDAVLETRVANKPKEAVRAMLAHDLGDDRVFAFMSHWPVRDFFDADAVAAFRERLAALPSGVILVYGVAASVCCPDPDLLVYADMARWEIQLRFRSGRLANWLDDNAGADPLRLYKRGFFVEWRTLDRHKRTLYDRMDYVLDTNGPEPKMMTGTAFRAGLDIAVSRPFRVKPYFDPGVWGGQWMKERFGLDPAQPNYAWSFDCVPEENSLLMDVGGVVLETPAINLVFRKPQALLGALRLRSGLPLQPRLPPSARAAGRCRPCALRRRVPDTLRHARHDAGR